MKSVAVFIIAIASLILLYMKQMNMKNAKSNAQTA